MEFIFEYTHTGGDMLFYVEVYNDVWSVHVYSCVDCDSLVLYNNFWKSL